MTHKHNHSEDPTIIATPSASTFLDEKALNDGVRIDLGDNLTPHNDPSNPFAFTNQQLSALMDPKNLPLLRSFGGLEGIARGLHVDLRTGLKPNGPKHPKVSLSQVMKESDDSIYVEDIDIKRADGRISRVNTRTGCLLCVRPL